MKIAENVFRGFITETGYIWIMAGNGIMENNKNRVKRGIFNRKCKIVKT